MFSLDLAAGIEKADPVTGVTYVETDVTDGDQVRAAVELASAGDNPLRTVVNCAGIDPSMRILGKEGVHDLDAYAKVISINLVGSFNVLALASGAIAATDPDEYGQRGVMINTASIAAYDGHVGQAACSSSKGGIAGVTLPDARDLAQYGIRVNTIAPASSRLRGSPRSRRSSSPAWPPVSRFLRGSPAPRSTRARAVDNRSRLPQRRDDPDGRRPTDGTAVTAIVLRPVGVIRRAVERMFRCGCIT